MWRSLDYRPEDLPTVATLIREQYGEVETSREDHLRWQYQAAPAGPVVARLAQDPESGRIVGHYAVVPMRFEVDGDDRQAVLSVNTLTAESHRGQGVFTGLAEEVLGSCRERGLAFCYGFPNPRSYGGFVRRLGFTDLGRAPLLLRPLHVRSLVGSRYGRLAAVAASPAELLYRPRDHGGTRYETRSLGVSDLGELGAFWERVRGKYRVMGVRDDDFLRWRYFEAPSREYLMLGLYSGRGDGIRGYAVGRYAEVAGVRAGLIVDMLLDRGLPLPAGRSLVERLLRGLADRGADLAGSLMLPHTEESRVLRACRFLTCPLRFEPQPFRVIYREFGEDREGGGARRPPGQSTQADLSRWFLTMGDYDVI